MRDVPGQCEYKTLECPQCQNTPTLVLMNWHLDFSPYLKAVFVCEQHSKKWGPNFQFKPLEDYYARMVELGLKKR